MNSMSKQAGSKVSDHFRQSRADGGRASAARSKNIAAAAPAAVPLAQPAAAPAQSADQDAADELALRLFDLDSRFGPCVGITRLERWERAASLGLEPPQEVLRLVQQHGVGSLFNKNVFSEEKPF